MKHKSEAMKVRDRVGVVSVDDCRISRDWTYDKGKLILYAPKSKAAGHPVVGMVNDLGPSNL